DARRDTRADRHVELRLGLDLAGYADDLDERPAGCAVGADGRGLAVVAGAAHHAGGAGALEQRGGPAEQAERADDGDDHDNQRLQRCEPSGTRIDGGGGPIFRLGSKAPAGSCNVPPAEYAANLFYCAKGETEDLEGRDI